MTDLIAELAEVVRMSADDDQDSMIGAGYAVRFIRAHHAEIEAMARDAKRFAPCLWVPDGDAEAWDTACGNKHLFIDGDAADNLYKHCPYCGGQLIEPNYDAPMRDSAREGGK